MIILRFAKTTSHKTVQQVLTRVRSTGGEVYAVNYGRPDSIDAICDTSLNDDRLLKLCGSLEVIRPPEEFILASRNYQAADTNIPLHIRWQRGKTPLIIAGPCSVEDRTQVLEIAHAVREAGADAFRGGAFKPRTSPYSFQGIGKKGYRYLAEVREETGLPVISEVMSIEQARIANEYIDVFQVGARNMQNTPLLNALGRMSRPVLLKRGMSATIEELLLAAEYIMRNGNHEVFLCERGIRTFEKETRFTFDLNAVPALKELSHLPVIADPSHATGQRRYVPSVALGAIAAGADGLLVEVATNPDTARSDSDQTLSVAEFRKLVVKARKVYKTIHTR